MVENPAASEFWSDSDYFFLSPRCLLFMMWIETIRTWWSQSPLWRPFAACILVLVKIFQHHKFFPRCRLCHRSIYLTSHERLLPSRGLSFFALIILTQRGEHQYFIDCKFIQSFKGMIRSGDHFISKLSTPMVFPDSCIWLDAKCVAKILLLLLIQNLVIIVKRKTQGKL